MLIKILKKMIPWFFVVLLWFIAGLIGNKSDIIVAILVAFTYGIVSNELVFKKYIMKWKMVGISLCIITSIIMIIFRNPVVIVLCFLILYTYIHFGDKKHQFKPPKFKKWVIIPSMQVGRNYGIEYSGIKISIEEVFFTYDKVKNKKRIDINLFIKGYNKRDENWNSAVFMLLEGVIGKKNIGNKLRQINFIPFKEEIKERVLPITELPAIIEKIKVKF